MKTDVMLELAMTSSSLVLDTTLNINILQVLFVTFHYTNYHITSILTASSNWVFFLHVMANVMTHFRQGARTNIWMRAQM